MALDIDSLVAPLSEEAPSGPDLYDDPERQEIERAFDRSVSEGQSVADADWGSVIKLITAQAGRTRDLWLPVYLMRAAASSGKFDSLVEGAELLARLVEDRWGDVHPQLEELGFIGRKAPCESLTRLAEFLTPLQQVPILQHQRFGAFTCSDLQRFHGEGADAEGYGLFRAAIEAIGPDELLVASDKVDSLLGAIRRVDSVLTANAEDDTSTNFEPTYDVLQRLQRAVKSFLPVEEEPAQPEPVLSAEPAAGGAPAPATAVAQAGGPGFSGAISSREDVRRALDSICAYYEKFEPASPVPFALRRAKEWISLDFMGVLEDIAPGSLGEAEKLLKSRKGGGASAAPSSAAVSVPAPAAAPAADPWGGNGGNAQEENAWGSNQSNNLWG